MSRPGVACVRIAAMTSKPAPRPARRKLSRAPVIEALLDIRVVPREGLTFADLKPLDALVAKDYPEREEKRAATFTFAVKDAKAQANAEMSGEPVGTMHTDRAKRNRVQFDLNGFTQNVLAPYADFETLVAKARPHWEAYVKTSQPRSIARMAVRYINQVRLPLQESLESNLLTFPVLPPAVPQQVSDFAFRITVHDPPREAVAIITQASKGVVDAQGLQVIVDIDAIMENQLAVDDSNLWARFETLRGLKNDVFFSILSPQLLEKYA